MKNIVISDEFKPKDFKPSSLLKEYLQLTQKETATLLSKGLKIVACPACGDSGGKAAFARFGLSYQHCPTCHSVYINPRPSDEQIVYFYQNSQARKFWNEHIYATTAQSRQEKIIKPRLQWIEDSTQEYLPAAKHYADINANQPGYIKQIASLSFQTKTLLNPLVPGVSSHDVAVKASAWWDAQGQWDVVSLFEVLDHTSDPGQLLNKVHSFLPQGGLCFLTSVLGSGFDIQTLWDKAEHVFPPDRLNMLSVEGVEVLAKRQGFEVLEFSTPGVLDVQLVAKAMQADPAIALPRFVEYLLNRSEDQHRAFQDFLQANLLSSYGRILLRKI
jgi:hypothetical protein